MLKVKDFDNFEQGLSETYYLTEHLHVCFGKKDLEGFTGATTIQPGFIFDVTSPYLLRWIAGKHDRQLLGASCIHDYLLKDGCEWNFAAQEFRRAMKARKIGFVRRNLIWAGVVVYGQYLKMPRII